MSPRQRRERLVLAIEGVGYLIVLLFVFAVIASLDGVNP